jgi:hypothetical protein
MGTLGKPLSPASYVAVFVSLIATFAAGLSLFAWSLGPPVGDLTRVAGLSEYRYGWNGVSQGFSQNYFERTSLQELEAGADPGEILVLGDSYSFEQGNNITWTNTLHALTGRSIRLVELRTFKDVAQYFRSPAYAKNPPEVVVIETAERLVYRRSETSLDEAHVCSAILAPEPMVTRPIEVARSAETRRKSFADFDEMISWGALAARLKIFLPRKVMIAQMNTSAHFSSTSASSLLFYFEDVTNHLPSAFGSQHSDMLPGRIGCVLANLVAAGASHSSVYLTVAPDKRTLYEPFLTASLPPKKYDMLEIASAALGPAYIDLYSPLRAQVANQSLDVYWPNDTHWGALGHELVGKTIAKAISAPQN